MLFPNSASPLLTHNLYNGTKLFFQFAGAANEWLADNYDC